MSNRLTRLLAALVLCGSMLGAGLVTSSASAAPDRRPCVTKGEWRKVSVDMPVRKVTQILDTRGYFTYRDTETYYPNVDTYKYYRGCGKYKNSYLEINFYNGRVYAKYSSWTTRSY